MSLHSLQSLELTNHIINLLTDLSGCGQGGQLGVHKGGEVQLGRQLKIDEDNVRFGGCSSVVGGVSGWSGLRVYRVERVELAERIERVGRI